MVARHAAKPKTAARKKAPAKADPAPLETVSRAPGVPATEDNTPAPAYDPDTPVTGPATSDPSQTATGLPVGPAAMHSGE